MKCCNLPYIQLRRCFESEIFANYDILDEIDSRIDEILAEDGLDNLVENVLDFKELRTNLI
jgi:hypothetical protein